MLRVAMFPRLAPSLCKLKKEITPLMREDENACRQERKETRRSNHLTLKPKMLAGFYTMRELSQ